ncbi:STAS domain-containing protein [Fusibacter sp. JL216-2]|uniref:STAS domain-containing protein n=1 Tax=Fusibacter sp. JL216-2 TaxID=3071453 RepID=UPI003D32AFAE
MKKALNDSVLTLTLQEDLIATNVRDFKSNIDAYLQDEMGNIDEVIMDLSACENIDSVGVTFVVGVYKQVTNDAMGFRIKGSSEEIKQLFKLMKLDEFFDM